MGRPKGGSNRYYSKQFKMQVINDLLNGEIRLVEHIVKSIYKK